MPKRVPLQSIVLTRPNKEDEKKPLRITPEIGKAFDFTADEIKHIETQSPGALSTKAVVSLTDDGKPAEVDGDDDENPLNDVTATNFAKAEAAKGGAAAAAAKTTARGGRGSSNEL